MEISVTKDGVKFSTNGDIGSANVICRQNLNVEKQVRRWAPPPPVQPCTAACSS